MISSISQGNLYIIHNSIERATLKYARPVYRLVETNSNLRKSWTAQNCHDDVKLNFLF